MLFYVMCVFLCVVSYCSNNMLFLELKDWHRRRYGQIETALFGMT
jgi:hypothetical protein